jgi:hypothetical protein
MCSIDAGGMRIEAHHKERSHRGGEEDGWEITCAGLRGSTLILSELQLVLWLEMMKHRDGEGGMVGEENTGRCRRTRVVRRSSSDDTAGGCRCSCLDSEVRARRGSIDR